MNKLIDYTGLNRILLEYRDYVKAISPVVDALLSDYIEKYLIKLYRALHPEDKKTEEKDIENVTIKNILTDQQYNDLGFRIGNTVLLLLEAQSTWTVNIIIRIMMYLMQTYNDYCTENGLDLYGAKKGGASKA